ncbi:MAG TPA: tetratricopeptide repeat protein [Saprospiraceae bacterium]|nr:tetratricopeptide repeat protein [Saprospiraceae bacterium]
MRTNYLFSVLLLFFAQTIFGQNLTEAKQLSEAGQYAGAEKIYNAALASNPDNVEALIGAGYNYSWWEKHEQAQQKFEAALALDPGNADALVGQGYNAAWAGNFEVAKNYFKKLEKIEPGSTEAQKGLGYVNLWSGNGQAAERYFENLILANPKEIEYYIALAQANLLESESKRARIALKSGLQIDPNHPVANELLEKTYAIASPLELDVWGGYSDLDGDSKVGLRTVQLSAQVAKPLRVYAKYDNSLSLDLASFVRANQEAQAFSLGGVMGWNPHLITRLEYGVRLLPDDVTQQLVSGEQVVIVSDRLSVKGGGFYGFSNNVANEWLAYGSFRVPLTAWYAVEPYYFISKSAGAPANETRFMVNNQFRSHRGYELNLGLLYGKAGVGDEVANKDIYGSYVTGLFPVSRTVWGMASLRYEKSPFQELFAASLGVKLRLER